MKRQFRARLSAALLSALLLTACARRENAPAPTETPAPTAEPVVTSAPTETPAPTEDPALLERELNQVRGLMEGGEYYGAFQALVALEEGYRAEPEKLRACEALFEELDRLLRELEPASGTELSRSFPVQGGGVLEISAFSGPALITVIDEYAEREGNPNPGAVTFYVRQGEVGQTHLPASTYRVRYQVGYRWFGEADGFGEYCTEGELSEPLVFDFYMDGQWASNAKYTITL